MNNKILLSIAVVLLICGGVYFSYNKFNTPVEIKEIKDPPFSILLKNATDTFVESADWYEAVIYFPKSNMKVRDQIIGMWEDFAKENQLKKYTNLAEAKEGLQINVDGLKYNFNANFRIATSSNTISYVYQIYTFTGGAHGGTQVLAITEDEKQNIIPIETILPTSKLQKVSELARADLVKQKKARDASYNQKNDTFLDEGVKPTRDNYSVAWYEGDNIVISFGQYQVGAYVDGIFEVRIPRSAVQ